jgi:hypothetical protein
MPQLRLKVAHTHAGVAYPPGHVIDVTDATARWLTQQDIATPADAEVHLPPGRESIRRSTSTSTTTPTPKE